MYEILWKDEPVGKAIINIEGLYYCINCSCYLPGAGIFRITVADGSNTYDLGICVPNGSEYSCVTRIPRKRFCSDNFKFILTDGKTGTSVLVATGKPFAYLDRLDTARLRWVNGQPEILIDPIPDQ